MSKHGTRNAGGGASLNLHAKICPCFGRELGYDFDPEECMGGLCTAALLSTADTRQWAPADVPPAAINARRTT